MYDDFTGSNVFIKDKDDNTIYFKNSTYYIIDDFKKQEKIRNLEGYRYFFQGTSKPIVLFLPILFIGVPISFLLQYFFFPELDLKTTPFFIGYPIYIIALYIYNLKIERIIKNCEVIPKESISERIRVKENSEYIKPSGTLKNEFKSVMPDMNIFHILIFLIIASPFLFVVFSIIIS